jgi:argininosuccinate lyase
MKMWAGRFRQPLDPEFEQWQRSLPFDRRLIAEEIASSCAWARALARAGVLNPAEMPAVVIALEQTAASAAADPAYLDDKEAEDIHHFVEKRLVELVGDVGYKLHTGRSRNEQIATGLRLFTRAKIDAAQELLLEFVTAFVNHAEKAGNAAMPAYTHLQPAEPVLVAHWLLAYAQMFLRDHERLADARKRVNLCPLGSGAVAGSPLALNREAIARELGFDAPTANSIDATSDRDFSIEFVQALAQTMGHLSRWAEELIVFATEPYGFAHMPEAFSTGSSAMPQKKNPDALELIRGKSARVIGAATTLLVATKGLPLAYNKDLQETQEPLFDAADTATQSLRTAAALLSAISFDLARMEAAAHAGGMNAFAAAMYLVRRAVPFRHAHERVGKAIQHALDKGAPLEALTVAELRQFSPEFDSDFPEAVALPAVLALHDVPGGTHPQRVAESLAAVRRQIAAARKGAHAYA